MGWLCEVINASVFGATWMGVPQFTVPQLQALEYLVGFDF